MLLWLVAWRGQRSCTLSCSSIHGQQLCRRLEVQPGSLLRIRISWLLCVRNRQALRVVESLLLMLLLVETVPMKPPPLVAIQQPQFHPGQGDYKKGCRCHQQVWLDS